MGDMSDKFDVGYKKPPKKHRFQTGQSGNPKGLPGAPSGQPLEAGRMAPWW